MNIIDSLRKRLTSRERRILLVLIAVAILVASISAYQILSGHALGGKKADSSQRDRSYEGDGDHVADPDTDKHQHDSKNFPTLAPEDVPQAPSVDPEPAAIETARQFAQDYYNTNAPPRVWKSNVLKHCSLIVCDQIIGEGQGEVTRLTLTGDPQVELSQQGYLVVGIPTSAGLTARITLGNDGTRWTVLANTLE